MSLLVVAYPCFTQWRLFLQDIQEPHHPQVHIIIFMSSSRGLRMFLTKFYSKMTKIWASRLAFSRFTFSFSLLITHINKFPALQLSLLIEQAAMCSSLTLGQQCMPLGMHTMVKLSLSAPFWRSTDAISLHIYLHFSNSNFSSQSTPFCAFALQARCLHHFG